jgi:NADPH:quinone reductase-like Zn-dependent oxidoreductase
VKAVVYDEYGPPEVLRLADVDVPVPGKDEVLVELTAVSLNRSDWESLVGRPLYARLGGLRRPRRRILGSDVAGRVAAVGAGVTGYRPGDRVFADVLDRLGGLAEYVRVPAAALARIPDGMGDEEAACLPQAGAIALHGIVGRGLGPGSRVLVNGAGGGGGMYAVQLAKLLGAEVTGVDSAAKLDFVRSLGADRVVDYEREDFTRHEPGYDLVLDLAGHRSVLACRRALAPGGRYLWVGGPVPVLLQVLLLGPLLGAGRRRLRILPVRLGAARVLPLAEHCLAGRVTTHVDGRHPLAESPDALRRLGAGEVRGKVVITIR